MKPKNLERNKRGVLNHGSKSVGPYIIKSVKILFTISNKSNLLMFKALSKSHSSTEIKPDEIIIIYIYFIIQIR